MRQRIDKAPGNEWGEGIWNITQFLSKNNIIIGFIGFIGFDLPTAGRDSCNPMITFLGIMRRC